MTDNLTSIEPQSIAADQEPEADTDLSTYRVLRRDESPRPEYARQQWSELKPITTKYIPLPEEIGEAYGEGDYLLIEKDGRYLFLSTYEMRVVAEKRYRLADDDA